jgi:hypothetical protein
MKAFRTNLLVASQCQLVFAAQALPETETQEPQIRRHSILVIQTYIESFALTRSYDFDLQRQPCKIYNATVVAVNSKVAGLAPGLRDFSLYNIPKW